MARTLDPAAHAVRREAFIETAQRLIQARGYERMSIQDVLDDVGASRGAFYHYFDGKLALLDAVVERMTDDAWRMLGETVDDPGRPAVEKLQAFFDNIADWKWERRDLVLGILEVWVSDDNAIVREKFRRRTKIRVRPLFARIVRQGCDEGTMQVDDPEAAAGVLATLVLGVNEAATEMFIEFQAGQSSLDQMEDRLFGYFTAFERIAGVAPGSIAPFQRGLLTQWFG